MKEEIRTEAKDFVTSGVEKASGQHGINIEVRSDQTYPLHLLEADSRREVLQSGWSLNNGERILTLRYRLHASMLKILWTSNLVPLGTVLWAKGFRSRSLDRQSRPSSCTTLERSAFFYLSADRI